MRLLLKTDLGIQPYNYTPDDDLSQRMLKAADAQGKALVGMLGNVEIYSSVPSREQVHAAAACAMQTLNKRLQTGGLELRVQGKYHKVTEIQDVRLERHELQDLYVNTGEE